MKTNKNVWILVIWLSLTVLPVEILSAQNSWNWFEAQQLCKENNNTLPKPNTFSSSTREHWTSRYTRYSFWIKILGCYNDTEPDGTQNFQMDIPSAGFCQEICATVNLSTFGIKQKECKCFGKLPLEQPVLWNNCNAVPQTTSGIIFTEHGSINAYTLYESDFNVTKRDKIYCVAIQCHKHKRFYFEPSVNCSLSHRAVCQNSVSESYQNWTSSMELCKKENSSYLAGNVSLNDIDQTCDRLNVTLTGPAWLGVAKELYTGSDRGVPVNEMERKSFLQCAKCHGEDCGYFADCTERLDTVYCEKGFSAATLNPVTTTDKDGTTRSVSPTSDISTQTSESLTNKPGTTQYVIYTSDAFKHTSETSTSKQGVNNSSNTLNIILPVVMAAIFIGCFATAAVFYIRRKRRLRNQNNKQLDSKVTDNNYTDIDIDVNNKNYFFIQPQSETNYSSSHIVQTDKGNPYKDTAEGIYDHLRDEESRKRYEEDGKENDSNPYKETDGRLYDHLRDTEFGKSTAENDYDHAPATAEQDYSGHGRLNEHTSDTEYDHDMSFYDYKQHNQVIEETDDGYAKTVNVS